MTNTSTLRQNWCGPLTVENLEMVCALLEELLSTTNYTLVTSNEAYGFRPEVATNQQLTTIRVWKNDTRDTGGIEVRDTAGVWRFMTSRWRQASHRGENPEVIFKPGIVTICQRGANGYQQYWVAAIQ